MSPSADASFETVDPSDEAIYDRDYPSYGEVNDELTDTERATLQQVFGGVEPDFGPGGYVSSRD
jgi:hypothetical protein